MTQLWLSELGLLETMWGCCWKLENRCGPRKVNHEEPHALDAVVVRSFFFISSSSWSLFLKLDVNMVFPWGPLILALQASRLVKQGEGDLWQERADFIRSSAHAQRDGLTPVKTDPPVTEPPPMCLGLHVDHGILHLTASHKAAQHRL